MKNAKPAKRRQPPRGRVVPIAQVEPAQPATITSKPSRFVFKPDVLERTGVTYVSIWKWMRDGRFPLSREVGGKVAWLESEIDTWIASRPVRRYKAMEGV